MIAVPIHPPRRAATARTPPSPTRRSATMPRSSSFFLLLVASFLCSGASAFGRFAAADESSLPMPDVAQPWTAQNGRSGPFIALACLLFAQRLAPEAPRGRGAP